jgi:uncharacterized membrane protein YfcA
MVRLSQASLVSGVSLPAVITIGLIGGFFSALFGAGNGSIVVPLLMLVAGLSAREATGTSLAAMLPTAAAGAIVFSFLGEVDWHAVAVVGLPGALGAATGVWLQRRLEPRTVALAFSVLLLAIAIRLFAE